MKNIKVLATTLLLLLGGLTMNAQTENGFKALDVQQDFTENAFNFFTGAPIIMAGDKEKSNAMTIGWGAMGNLWGFQLPTITVYVAQKRYTHDFMEKYPYFTVMEFDDSKVAEYMGHHSGRDGDKGKALGLHVAYTKNGTPYYKEASSVYECEIMYAAPFEEKYYRNDVPKKFYSNFPAGAHTMYIGKVVNAWKK
ncbi:MAG: flavin reductase [Prevotella sp.]|jgi:flavin reductase (DIM6/NTAB) family NADH-FMN oxidoreductase RutF